MTPSSFGQFKPPPGAVLNPSHPLAQGLAGAWLFNEAAGLTVFDWSRRGNSGKLTNGAAFADAPGFSAAQFDGVNDFVSTAVIPVGAGAFTMAVRFYVTGSMTAPRLLGDDQNGTPFHMVQIASAIAQCQVRDVGNNLTTAAGTTTLVASTWYWLIGVKRGTTLSVYLNARLEGTATNAAMTGSVDTGGVTTIGSRTNGTNPMTGYISDAFKWVGNAFTADEVAAFVEQPYQMFLPVSQNRSSQFGTQTLAATAAVGALAALAATLSPGARSLNATAAQAALVAVTAALAAGAKTVLLTAAEAQALAGLGVLSAGAVTLTGTAAQAVLSAVTAMLSRGGPAVQYHARVADVNEYHLRVEQ